MKTKGYHIWTIGCQMNEADSRHLGSQLEALGYRELDKPEGADIIVLNTCVVRQQAEDKGIGKLKAVAYLKKRNPEVVLGLMGCMVGMREHKRLAEQFPYVDVFMPPSEPKPLLDFLAERAEAGDPDATARVDSIQRKAVQSAVQDEEYILPALRQGGTVCANVPIVLGCSHACTFCIIPYRRGAERSRPREDILREVEKLTRQGVREIMLLGQIVDRYGEDFDHDYDLADLLRDVSENENVLRIRFLTGHPNYFTDRMIEAVRDLPKVMPHFELPVQAGNDEVLENMNRGYTADEFRKVVARVREKMPEATINTDIIVGFPGETEAQFMDTYRLMEELRLDKIHLAKYSERPKTIAARKMPDDVSDEDKEDRRLRLDALNNRILEEKNAPYVGTTTEVLVESKAKDKWRGRDPHNRLVFFSDDRDLTGAVVQVAIHWAGPFSLQGNLVDVLVPPLKPKASEVAGRGKPASDPLPTL